MSRILVTGGTGFVGKETVRQLRARGNPPALMIRDLESVPEGASVIFGDLTDALPSADAFRGVEAVIHLAARAHVMQETAPDPLAEFRRINRDGTLKLARRAREGGARRFVFLSSIKVNGEATTVRPFTASDPPSPRDSYGVSKWEAEQALAELSRATGLEVVVIRSPLIHGPGAKGNLHRLLQFLQCGLPLPLGSVRNRRRMVGIRNLADLLILAATHPEAPGGTFLAGDAEVCSTPELLRLLAAGLGVAPRLFPFPPDLFRALSRLTGQGAWVERLIGSLDLDITATTTRLGWQPRVSLADGLLEMARAWKA